MPELIPDPAPPDAVKRAPLPPRAKLFWTLKAVYPTPDGTVWVRYSERPDGDSPGEFLEALTAAGTLLQRVETDASFDSRPPAGLQALYLQPARRRGPVLYFPAGYLHYLFAFPDGFSGFLSENGIPAEDDEPPLSFVTDRRGFTAARRKSGERYLWTGVSFVEYAQETLPAPDICEGTAPRRLPLPPVRGETRFAAACFDRVYLLRWTPRVGNRATLEVSDRAGRRLARHPLPDNFGAGPRDSSLSALWLDEKRRRGPVIVVRDSDSVRVLVFGDGLRTLRTSQDFSDFSNSISSTTTDFGRDASGMLTVTESTIERGDEDGKGGARYESRYVWNGRRFVVVRVKEK